MSAHMQDVFLARLHTFMANRKPTPVGPTSRNTVRPMEANTCRPGRRDKARCATPAHGMLAHMALPNFPHRLMQS